MKNTTVNSRTILVHVLLWTLFLGLPVFFSPTAGGMSGDRLPFHFYIPYIASAILLVSIYYLNYSILTPRWFFSRRYIVYFSIIAVLLFLLLIVPEIDHLFEKGHRHGHYNHSAAKFPGAGMPRRNKLLHFSPFELQIFVMGILVIIVSTLMSTVRRLRESEQEKSSAELSFLKAQINPHFLFNTLNSIYSLAYKKSDETAPAIVKLSGLMRHVITDAQKEELPLAKEVEYISNYIELQKLRLTEATHVSFHVQGELDDKMIAPLVLLPFIENAFKYGSNPEKPGKISISIEATSATVQFDVSNTIVNTENIASDRIGVGNAIERLKLIYPGKHLVNIHQQENEYSVSIHIHLK